MRYDRFSLTALAAVIVAISTPLPATLPALFQMSQVLAQTPANRKTQAERLFKQGREQFETSQFEAALQSWQQALIIYREIKDRQGEGAALGIAIAPLLNTKAIIGSQATKAAIVQKMPTARIIHFATHGLLDDNRGLGSAIALAPDSSLPKPAQINGLLTAEEILDMNLQADLVVLSACDTGRGRITGDGVIGLSRSLISAGVPSVMVSLWSVPDSPTAELMTQFYKNFRQRKLNKATALREAMLTTMKTHPNPRDWAAFTLIGEAEGS